MTKLTLKASVLLLSFAALVSVVINARPSDSAVPAFTDGDRTQLSVMPVAELK